MLTIIDVSRAQGHIVWSVLAASGRVAGVIMKATEGAGPYVDESFATNFAEAHACGLLLGTYHFAHPDETDNDAAIEARHYVSTVLAAARRVGVTTPLLFALDVEECRKIRKGPTFVAWCRKFVETVEAMTGLVCWVYTGGPFWNDADGDINADDAAFFAARPLWLAAYVNDPAKYAAMTPWRLVGATVHQWSGDTGPNKAPGIRYPGIAGNVVDTNRFGGSLEDLRALIAKPAPSRAMPILAPPNTRPETPTSRSSTQLRVVREPIADLSLDSPATPLRAGEGEHTPLHLRDEPPDAA